MYCNIWNILQVFCILLMFIHFCVIDKYIKLAAGCSQLAAGCTQLAAGCTQLAAGCTQLAAGCTQLAAGCIQLAAGCTGGRFSPNLVTTAAVEYTVWAFGIANWREVYARKFLAVTCTGTARIAREL